MGKGSFDLCTNSMYNLRFPQLCSRHLCGMGRREKFQLFDEVAHVRGHKNRWQTI